MTGYKNCHSRGLHSIVLKTYPDGRPKLRMFCADENHLLYKNNPIDNLSIAIHPHRFDLTIHHLHGPLANINLIFGSYNNYDLVQTFMKYRYKSAILTGQMEFTYIDIQRLKWEKFHSFAENERLFLKASQLHTVNVAKGFRAAWLIEEGDLDSNYDALVYTKLKPEIDIELYQPMNEAEINSYIGLYSKELVHYFFDK